MKLIYYILCLKVFLEHVSLYSIEEPFFLIVFCDVKFVRLCGYIKYAVGLHSRHFGLTSTVWYGNIHSDEI
jgi:hypothetical protein